MDAPGRKPSIKPDPGAPPPTAAARRSSTDTGNGTSSSTGATKPAPPRASDAVVDLTAIDPTAGVKQEAKPAAPNGTPVKGARDPHKEPEHPRDDWQVAYTWAFIVKFELRDKIRNLNCLEDLEISLLEQVAQRPDDVFEGILVRFLQNLRPTLRNINCTNIQGYLSNYISDMLETSHEFTVWDEPWLPNEESRGGCCTKDEDRQLRGRLRAPGEERKARLSKNPLKRMEETGQGVFELEWSERAKLLRQLVDWQLTHADAIREYIKDRQPTGKRTAEALAHEKELLTEPIGLDHNKQRVWSLDSSARLYTSGNPFKRPCPLVSITSTREEVQALQERYAAYGATELPAKPSGSGPKGKVTKKDEREHLKVKKGIEDERKLAVELAEVVLPRVEKDEARVQRARKKAFEVRRAQEMMSERPSRTRRTTKKVDYTYDGFDSDDGGDDDGGPRGRGGRRKVETGYDPNRGRPVIPGERRSARQLAVQAVVEQDAESYVGGSSAAASPRDDKWEDDGGDGREAMANGDDDVDVGDSDDADDASAAASEYDGGGDDDGDGASDGSEVMDVD